MWHVLEGEYLEDLDVDGKLILKLCYREIGQKDLNSINLAQDRDQCSAPLNMEIKFRFP
jgi:hypothetical protein